MFVFKIIRKIGKILRGGAGRKEILLGTVCGVLIGFNPGVNMTLAFAILITLLLNANISFTLLGAALGKVLCLALAPVTFHTGFFIIHNMGMENSFTDLVNSPVTALMDLNVYALVGSLPYALMVGIGLGTLLGSIIVRIRKKMLEADQHEIIGKTFNNKISRLLLRLAFGKSKLSLNDEVAKQAPLLRRAGIILVAVVLGIGLALDFLLLDIVLKKSIQSSISAKTGAEVNIGKAHLSLAGGKLELKNLQVTDPDKPTHNMIQLETLTTDVSIRDLLRRNYVIDLLAGDVLKRDVRRYLPGEVYVKKEIEEEEKSGKEALPGKSLEDYFAQAQSWQKYSDTAYKYLKDRKKNSAARKKGKVIKISKEDAVANAKQLGYLKASADLVADHPTWIVRRVEIGGVELGGDYPVQTLQGSNLSSHPEMVGKPTVLSLTPEGGKKPTAKFVLRFDNPDAKHAMTANVENISLKDTVETSEAFPVDINDGKAAVKADGTFSVDALNIPFTIAASDLKADVEAGETIMGMDAVTATEVFNSIEQLEIEGTLTGALNSPRIEVDYDKLSASIKEALVAAGKKELSKRADAEMDKAKEELKKQAGEELDKAMQSKEAEEAKSKATDAIKKLF
jgi:uncharacterized protein (TIGR03546 family)